MNCIKCKGKAHKNGHESGSGLQKYHCTVCGYNFNEGQVDQDVTPEVKKTVKQSISMSELRSRHDVDFKVLKALKALRKGEFIEKDEVIRRIGLRAGYPRLSATLDSHKEYFGKADSKIYWGHPEEIAELKEEQILS